MHAKIRWALALLLLGAVVFHPWIIAFGLRFTLWMTPADADAVNTHGYRSLEVSGLRFDGSGLRLKVKRLEIDQPWTWLKEKFGWGREHSTVVLSDWQIEITGSGERPKTQRETPLPTAREVKDLLDTWWLRLNWWIPTLEADAGTVVFAGTQLRVSDLLWRDRRLQFVVATELRGEEFVAHLETVAISRGSIRVQRADETWLEASYRLRERDQDLLAEMDGTLLGNNFTLNSTLGRLDALPDLELSIPQVAFDATRVGQDWLQVSDGRIRFVLNNGNWTANVRLDGTVETPDAPASELLVNAEAAGTLDRLEIQVLQVNSPFLEADLASPFSVDWQAGNIQLPETLNFELDLDPLSSWGVAGQLSAQVRNLADDTAEETEVPAHVMLTLAGSDLTLMNEPLTRLEVELELEGQDWTVHELAASMGDASVRASGRGNFTTREIGLLELDASVPRTVLSRFVSVPDAIQFERVEIDGSASGPLMSLESQGDLRVTGFEWNVVRPFDATSKWTATGWQNSRHELALEFEEAAASAEIVLTASTTGFQAEISSLGIGSDLFPEIAQTGTAQVSVAWPGASLQELSVRDVYLESSDTEAPTRIEFDGEWLPATRLEASGALHAINGGHFRPFVTLEFPDFAVEDTRFSASERSGSEPIAFDGTLDTLVRLRLPDQPRFAIRGRLEARDRMLRASDLVLSLPRGDVLAADAVLPLSVRTLGGKSPVSIRHDEAMQADIRTVSTEMLSRFFQRVASMTTDEPYLELRIAGTPNRPELGLNARAAQFALPQRFANEVFQFSSLDAQVRLERDRIEVVQAGMSYEGRPAQLAGAIPFQAPVTLKSLLAKQWPELRLEGIRGRASLDKLPMAVIADRFPDFVGRTGSLSVDLEKDTGKPVSGRVSLSNVQSRPLPNGTFLHEVDAELSVADRRFVIESFDGKLSQRPMTVTGFIDLSELEQPRFDLELKGANLPLVRSSDLLLRSDIDLRVARLDEDPATITGELQFRESFFSQGMLRLIRPRVATARARPPYFSVDQDPFSQWQLDVDIRGREFFRIDTQVFRGVASADFKLGGTLREPTLVGRAFVDQGRITLAFGTLRVQSGEIWTTVADPYTFNLFVETTGRAYGYDIDGAITGTLQNPIPNLNSSPPLSPEEIFLLLTAGVIPERGQAGAIKRSQAFAVYFGSSFISQLFPGSGSSFTEDLQIEYGQEISEKGKETYAVEYEISDDVSVRGEYDKYDEYVFTIKYEIYSR